MVNTTKDKLIVIATGTSRANAVRSALVDAASIVLNCKQIEPGAVSEPSTRERKWAYFPAIVELCLKNAPDRVFNTTYLQTMLDICMSGNSATESQYYLLTRTKSAAELAYVATRARAITLGINVSLVLLHARGQVVLPTNYPWPMLRGPGHSSLELGDYLEEGLIRLLRQANPANPAPPKALQVLPDHRWGRIDVMSRGTRVLLPLGWTQPTDANIEDIRTLVKAWEENGETVGRLTPYLRQLILLFREQYGSAFRIDLSEYDDYILGIDRRVKRANQKFNDRVGNERVDVFALRPRDGMVERLEGMTTVPGLTVDLREMSRTWLMIQRGYRGLRRKKIQSKYADRGALAYLNLYLFYYLPYWFADNPTTKLLFPSSPKLLLTSVFVSPIFDPEFPIPLRLTEFLEQMSEAKDHEAPTAYASLKGIAGLFSYIQQHSRELPDCEGFTQPLSSYDFPRSSGPSGTDKRPIPRRLFPFYLSYVDAVLGYVEMLLERVVGGEITQDQLHSWFANPNGVRPTVDTRQLAHAMRVTPIALDRDKWHALHVVPNVFYVDDRFPVVKGGYLNLPQPHGCINVLVALYTGIRNQHIQWLDNRTFDKLVTSKGDFAELHVNTDKVKRKPWNAYVNRRVIELLRTQRTWRSLVAHKGFDREIFYEHNKDSPWAPIMPVFALSYDGSPHPDSRYSDTWARLMMGVVGMLPTIGVSSQDAQTLISYLPPRVSLDDPPDRKREQYGVDSPWARGLRLGDAKAFTPLNPRTHSTPHSARVGVVSHYVQYLPADLLGRLITGQKEATVHHYVKLDPNKAAELQQRQTVAMQVAAFGRDVREMEETGEPPRRYIKADRINAALARGIQSRKIEETIADFGCISLVLNDEGRSGIDVLKETRGVGVAFNKTEVCPYKNRCPAEVVKKLRGWHRCGICPYAVRSIDHLPAIGARRRQLVDSIEALEKRLEGNEASRRFTESELEAMAEERQRLSEEAVGFKLSEEVLERQRQAIAAGKDQRQWAVSMPDIIRMELSRVESPNNETAYILSRLTECVAYPSFDSPEIRAQFDLLRRQFLAKNGRVREALASAGGGGEASECLAQIKLLADANGIALERMTETLLLSEREVAGDRGATLLVPFA